MTEGIGMFKAYDIRARFGDLPEKAMDALAKLEGCDVHSTVILARVDENVFQRLGMHLTCEPHYQSKKLYHGKK